MKFSKNIVTTLSVLVSASAVVLAGLAACSREPRNPKVKIHIVDAAPKAPPAPETAKTGDANTAVKPAPVETKPALLVAKPEAAPASVRPVSWEIVNEKVIKPRCVSCHSAASPGGGLDLTSAEKFKEAAPNIFAFVFYPPVPEAKMPIGGDLTPEQKQVLGDYMIDGLLN